MNLLLSSTYTYIEKSYFMSLATKVAASMIKVHVMLVDDNGSMCTRYVVVVIVQR